MNFLRSVLVCTPLIVLSTIVMGTLSFVASLFPGAGRTLHVFARAWAKSLIAVSFIRVRTEGLDQIDWSRSYVFVANHASFLDIPVLLATLRTEIRFFAKKGLFQIPFLGTHLGRAGHFPVDRSSPRASLRSMSDGAQLIAQCGVSVLLFPEGGRSQHSLEEFREGAAYIAIKAGVPVVPVGIVGMRRVLPMGSGHIRGGPAVVRVGDPISTAGLKLSARMELTERLRDEVARLSEDHLEPRPLKT